MKSTSSTHQAPIFHEGELAIQNKLGVAKRMDKFGRMVIRDLMPQQHQDFYESLPMLFVGFTDEHDDVWASVLANQHAFLKVKHDRAISVNAQPFEGDPLKRAIVYAKHDNSLPFRLGILGIELHSRRRNRMSMQLADVTELGFDLDVVQTFGNCPQYIQNRQLVPVSTHNAHTQTIEISKFNADLKSFIENADTFFVASSTQKKRADELDDTSGADVSHRGGRPGFVRVDDDYTLTIPDYMGNNHFNTLGNFLVNDAAGLLFIDFETGDIITLTGNAEILWDDESQKNFQGAERLWQFKLKKGYILKAAMPYRFNLQDWSPNTLMTGTWPEASQLTQQKEVADQWITWRIKKTIDESSQIRSFYFDIGNDVIPSLPSKLTLRVKIISAITVYQVRLWINSFV